jgi:hypothetical protein
MMFLALRAMPNRTAARQELISAAVALDRKFSAEKGLPKVFTGKVNKIILHNQNVAFEGMLPTSRLIFDSLICRTFRLP